MAQAQSTIHAPKMSNRSTPLVWMHIGDLHLNGAELPNHLALREITSQANAHLAGQIDFVVLPGGNTDDGTTEQYKVLRGELDRLTLPVHSILGDHDFKSRNANAFCSVLGARRLPCAITVGAYRCVFLDYVAAGTGGPDFRLRQAQLDWLRAELSSTAADRVEIAVSADAYPADLAGVEKASAFHERLREYRVAVVDMGHTHYNELANDGRTIYASTRSTGQIEEGPVGFSLLAIDEGVVSWRFKPIDEPWPLAMITSPADRRPVTRAHMPDHVPASRTTVRAKARSPQGVTRVDWRMDESVWQPIDFIESEQTWTLECRIPDRVFPISVRATDGAGSTGVDSIEATTMFDAKAERTSDGSDRDAVGAWTEKHLLGTQLRSNRNGRKW